MSTWHPDEHGTTNTGEDYTMGEGQATSEWSVRLVRDDNPGVHVDITAAARTGTGAPGPRRYYPEIRVTYRMFTDPADPGGTQTWEDEQTDTPDLYDYETPEQAHHAARDLIQTYTENPDGLLMHWPPQDTP
jgi:hypothetical protein